MPSLLIPDDVGWITRTHLGLDPLPLFSTGGNIPTYDFIENGLQPGQAQQRRQSVEAAWIPGAEEMGSAPGMAQATYSMFVTGDNGIDLDANIGALVAAVYEQPTWELHVLFGAVRYWAWRHFRAEEPEIGFIPSAWSPDYQGEKVWAPVSIICPRHPVLIAGPYGT